MNEYKQGYEKVLKNKSRNKKIMAASMMALLIGSIIFVIGMQAGHLYYKNLYEVIPIQDAAGDGSETLSIDAYVYIRVKYEGDSEWTLHYYGHNQLQDQGRNETRNYIADQTYVNSNATTNAFRWIGIGEGTGQSVTDNDLATPFARASATFAEVASTYNYTLTYTWTAGTFGGETIQESGTFNDGTSPNGIMLNYQSFAGIVLQAGDSLQVIWEFQIGV